MLCALRVDVSSINFIPRKPWIILAPPYGGGGVGDSHDAPSCACAIIASLRTRDSRRCGLVAGRELNPRMSASYKHDATPNPRLRMKHVGRMREPLYVKGGNPLRQGASIGWLRPQRNGIGSMPAAKALACGNLHNVRSDV